MSETLSFRVNNDLFKNIDTRLFLRGKELHDYDKTIIVEVVKYYMNNLKTNPSNPLMNRNHEVILFFKNIFKNPNVTLQDFMSKTQSETVEEFLAYCLIAFQEETLDLMVRTVYTFGRIKPMDSITEWADNFRLNGYGNVLNRIMYKKYDHPSIYTIDYMTEPLPINQSVEINYERMKKFVIGPLTAFIINHDIFPDVLRTTTGVFVSRNLTDKEICDFFYEHFVMGFLGAHGCDVFDLGMTLTLQEIDKVLTRYPSLKLGMILNTDGYQSGTGGSHWVALMLSYKKALLICSQAGSFNIFNDKGKLHNTLRNMMFGLTYNPVTIQTDSYNCGFYSVMALYALLCHNDVQKAVEAIGVDATNLVSGFDMEKIRSKIVGVKG